MEFKELVQEDLDLITKVYKESESRKQAQSKLAIMFNVTERTIRTWVKNIGIVGDDNIKVCLGYGKVAANKLLYGVKSELDCIKRVYGLYLELYGADAKRLFKETHKLLKLRTDANSEIRIGL